MLTYEDFRADYEKRHPASVPKLKPELDVYPPWLERIVGLMFICASLLSGVHTVPAVRNGMDTGFWGIHIINAIALTSYIAIELVFFVAAYALMRRPKPGVLANLAQNWHIYLTLLAAFIVAMVANLNENNKAYASQDVGTIIVAAVLGVGAPFIAFMAGKMFVDIHRARRSIGVAAQEVYEKAMVAWDKLIDREYRKELSNPSTVQYSSNGQSNGQTGEGFRPSASILGHTKRPDASAIVQQYLAENEQDIDRDARELARMLGVGKSTVNNVQRAMRSHKYSQNGHNQLQ